MLTFQSKVIDFIYRKIALNIEGRLEKNINRTKVSRLLLNETIIFILD